MCRIHRDQYNDYDIIEFSETDKASHSLNKNTELLRSVSISNSCVLYILRCVQKSEMDRLLSRITTQNTLTVCR
jgi:hypothetical protein